MLGELNHITTSQGITDLGIDELSFATNRMTVFGWEVPFPYSDLYWCKDSNKDIYYFTTSSSLAQNAKVGIWDNLNKVFLWVYSSGTSYPFTSLSELSEDIVDLNNESIVGSGGYIQAMPNPYNFNMLHMRGASNYMYTDVYTFDGVKSDLVWIVGTPAGGNALANAFNTDLTLDDGTVLTPIWTTGSGTTNSKTWLAIKSSTSNDSYSRGGDVTDDTIDDDSYSRGGDVSDDTV